MGLFGNSKDPYKKKITVQDVLDLLNELLQQDPEAVKALVNSRVRCNKRVANHPTIQVAARNSGTSDVLDEIYEFGLLGLLNGLFGVDENGYGPFMAVFDEDEITEFITSEEYFEDPEAYGYEEETDETDKVVDALEEKLTEEVQAEVTDNRGFSQTYTPDPTPEPAISSASVDEDTTRGTYSPPSYGTPSYGNASYAGGHESDSGSSYDSGGDSGGGDSGGCD